MNGFQGGEWNELAQALVIQGQHAHAWTEVYDSEKDTWNVFDATPNQPSTPDVFSMKSLKQRLTETYDYLDINWYTYVANYNSSAQRELFQKTVPYLPFVLMSLGLALSLRPLRHGYRKLRVYLGEDYGTRLERFLGGKNRAKFALLEYQTYYPGLVERTRKILYGQ